MNNQLAEAINIVRAALLEIERREKAAASYVAEQQKVADELTKSIDALRTERDALEKSVADARKAAQQKMAALKAATESVLKGI